MSIISQRWEKHCLAWSNVSQWSSFLKVSPGLGVSSRSVFFILRLDAIVEYSTGFLGRPSQANNASHLGETTPTAVRKHWLVHGKINSMSWLERSRQFSYRRLWLKRGWYCFTSAASGLMSIRNGRENDQIKMMSVGVKSANICVCVFMALYNHRP